MLWYERASIEAMLSIEDHISMPVASIIFWWYILDRILFSRIVSSSAQKETYFQCSMSKEKGFELAECNHLLLRTYWAPLKYTTLTLNPQSVLEQMSTSSLRQTFDSKLSTVQGLDSATYPRDCRDLLRPVFLSVCNTDEVTYLGRESHLNGNRTRPSPSDRCNRTRSYCNASKSSSGE